jgi:hypothetical protein
MRAKIEMEKRGCRLSNLSDLLSSCPKLTPEELESFSIDLEAAHAEGNSKSAVIRVHSRLKQELIP